MYFERVRLGNGGERIYRSLENLGVILWEEDGEDGGVDVMLRRCGR